VQQHVHAADAQHGVVEVVAVEHRVVEVLPLGSVRHHRRVGVAEVLGRGDEEARGAAGWVDDLVGRLWRGHRHHELDDVSRGAELAVLAGGGDLAEHVLVEVAVGVAVGHRHVVEHVDDLGEQRRGGDREARVLHVVGVGRLIAAELTEEGKDLLADDLEHDGGVVVLEPAPAEMVLAGEEGGVLDGLLEAARAVLLEGLELVESPDEQEICDLLDHLDGVADATGPEGVPDAVDLALEVSGDHTSHRRAARVHRARCRLSSPQRARLVALGRGDRATASP
jgi:hypothetical protein